MTPVTRFWVNIVRMGLTVLLLAYVVGVLVMEPASAATIVAALVVTLVALLELGHILAALLGYRSIYGRMKEQVRGRTHNNRS